MAAWPRTGTLKTWYSEEGHNNRPHHIASVSNDDAPTLPLLLHTSTFSASHVSL
jgi:hypothetical protein